MGLYNKPMEVSSKILTGSVTLKPTDLEKYSTFSVTGSSATITLPTPNIKSRSKPIILVNNTAGNITLACSSGFVQGGSTVTVATTNAILVYATQVSAGTYKWVVSGNVAVISGLQETVEDYVGGLFAAGTPVGVTVTYDDAGGAESIALIYGVVGELKAVSATIAGAAAGTTDKAARVDHVHANIAHTHADATNCGTIAHTALTSIGTHTHAEIDSHLDATGNTAHGLGTISTQDANAVSISGGAITGITDLAVADGGTGASTLTDHGILLGSGTGAITPLGSATNGQLPIGSTGADPVLAAITAGDGIDVTNGAGSIQVDVDLKANGGLVIETTELAVDLGASAITGTLAVGDGGTGCTTLTDHGLLTGNATGAVACLAEATDGQLPIGDTGGPPILATLTAGNGIDVTNAAGSITLAANLKTGGGLIIDTTEIAVDATATPTASKIPIADGSGKLDGWISTATAATPGLVEHLNWGDFAPGFTWDVAPGGPVTSVGRYRHVGNAVEFYASARVADSDGKKITGFVVPVVPVDKNCRVPLACIALNDTGGTIASLANTVAWIDADTPSTTAVVLQATAFTDNKAVEFCVSGKYEVAAT